MYSCTLRRLTPRYMLTLEGIGGVEVTRIGKGQFCTAYRCTNNEDRVYLVVDDERGDYSKDILADCDGPYFPELEKVGDLRGKTVWRTHYYRRLKASDTAAWQQFKLMAGCNLQARAEILSGHADYVYRGREAVDRTIDLVRVTDAELADALQVLADAAANYGSSYTFEFAVRNLAVDSDGHLILLDPVFDLETMAKENRKREKRARGY